MRKVLSKAGRAGVFVLVAVVIVLLDQLSKAWVRSALTLGGPRTTLIPHVLDWLWVENTGAAFSLGEGRGIIFIIVAIVIALTALVYTWASDDMPLFVVIPLACVAGGGVGNLIDRLAKGSVTDFFATSFIDFPVFNVADIFVTCGVVLCFIAIWRWDAHREQKD